MNFVSFIHQKKKTFIFNLVNTIKKFKNTLNSIYFDLLAKKIALPIDF